MTLTAIDPGIKQMGWAHFDGATLVSAGLSRFPKDAITWDMNIADYAAYHATQIPSADLVVIEGMFQYPPGPDAKLSPKAQIAAANDLLRLQAVGCLAAGHIGQTFRLYTAVEWKGQTDKDVTRFRVDGIINGARHSAGAIQIHEEEALYRDLAKVPKSLQHNVFDAVALGLTVLGRIKK